MNQLNKLFLILPLVLLSFCAKDPILDGDNLGGNLLKSDSTVFEAYTVLETPSNAFNQNDVVLGKLNDADFGNVLSSFYAQLNLSTNSFLPGENALVDSAVLFL